MTLDTKFFNLGFKYICGIDEAGRGPWAGAVFVSAVILPQHHTIRGLDDSKKLSKNVRESLFGEIINQAISYSIVSVSEKKIDKLNILGATKYGVKKSIKELSVKPDFILLDALNINLPEIPQLNLIKGDQRSEAIAAASILAKVSRDRYMDKLHERYPEYGFQNHKGYGTKQHQDALNKYGPCKIHRMTFAPVKALIN